MTREQNREEKHLIVAKFGGSSLADAGQFKKVKRIVESNPSRRYIVPSAPGKRSSDDNKITDLLYLCQQNAGQNMPFDGILQLVMERYLEIAEELQVDIDLEGEFEEIRKNLKEGASEYYAASRGEYINAKLLAKYLDYPFVDSKDIIIISRSTRKTRWAETQDRIVSVLSSYERAVIPGFYGSSVKGEIMTYSRGGSDVTGSVLAQGLGADIYENWTDVSGMLMADPRIVPNAKPIKELSYRELRELTYMGASVLHDEAVFPAMRSKIPINIKNTNRPEDHGTMIMDERQLTGRKDGITGISGKKGFKIIQIEKILLNSEKGILNRLLTIFEFNDVSIEHVPTGIDSISVVVSEEEFETKETKIIREIEKQIDPDHISIESNMALIAIVGVSMAKSIGTSQKVFTSLAEEDINIKMITQGPSEISIFIGIEDKDMERGIRAIYQAFER